MLNDYNLGIGNLGSGETLCNSTKDQNKDIDRSA